MHPITAFLYERFQEGMEVEVIFKKIDGFLRHQGQDEQSALSSLKWFFRNSDKYGRKYSTHHHSLY